MAFSLAVNAASLLNQFAWPVTLQKVAWKTYICLAVGCSVQDTVPYFTRVEAKRRTLDDLDEIFATKNHLKAAIWEKFLAVDDAAHVVAVKESN